MQVSSTSMFRQMSKSAVKAAKTIVSNPSPSADKDAAASKQTGAAEAGGSSSVKALKKSLQKLQERLSSLTAENKDGSKDSQIKELRKQIEELKKKLAQLQAAEQKKDSAKSGSAAESKDTENAAPAYTVELTGMQDASKAKN